jgi:outer membrane protein assembly factor BamB
MVVAGGGAVWWLHATEHFARAVGTLVLVLAVALMVSLWLGATWRRPMRGLAVAGLGWLVVGGLMLGLTRYEGSRDGSSLPRLVPVWSAGEEVVSPGGGVQERVGELGVVRGSSVVDEGDLARAGLVDFPRFLGPAGDGVVGGMGLGEAELAAGPELLWRRAVGVGWSGFVVVGGSAVTMEQWGEQEMVTCYDVLTGELLWATGWTARFAEAMGGEGPRATPTVEGGLVYVVGATGVLACLRLEDGLEIWRRDVLGGDNITWGKSNSPVVVDGMVVVTGGMVGPALMAFDAKAGKPLWQVGAGPASYATPVVAELGGLRQLVVVEATSVAGYGLGLDGGAELWREAWPGNFPKVAQPQIIDDRLVLLTASYQMGSRLLDVAGLDGGGWSVGEIWSGHRMKTKFSNVCVKDGYAYGLDEGRLACLEAATGERVWRGEKFGYGQNLLAGDVLVVQAELRGDVALVAATPEGYREIGRFRALEDQRGKAWNPPCLAGRVLLVRSDVEAACWRFGGVAGVEEGNE